MKRFVSITDCLHRADSARKKFAAFSLTLDPSPAGRGRQQADAIAQPGSPSRLRLTNLTKDGERFSLSQRERAGVGENGRTSDSIDIASANRDSRKAYSSKISVLLLAALGLAITPLQTQTQVIGGWPVGTPQPIVQGPDLASSLRNAIQATSDQCRLIIQTANTVGRRAQSAGYLMQNLNNDYQTLQVQFQNLRATFNVAGNWALQVGTASASNSAAELDSALNIIAEAFQQVQEVAQSGGDTQGAFVNMCQVLAEAMQAWQAELKKDSSRLGVFR